MTQTVLLGDVSEVIDSLHQTPKYSSTGLPMVRVTDIKPGYLDTRNCFLVSTEVYEQFSKKHKPKIGDIIFSRVGSEGIPTYVNDQEDFCLGQNTALIHPKINSKYLYYWLISPEGKQQIAYKTTGSTQKTISLKSIKELTLLLPSEQTQEYIVNMLGTLDEKIELNRQMDKTLEQMGQALFKHYFIDNPEAREWEQITLDQICERVGSGGTPLTNRNDYYSGEVSWFSTKELKDGFLFDSEKSITDSGLVNSAAKLFPKNTVLIAIYAAPTVGRLGILTHESTFNQAACGLVALPKFGYEFIYLYLLLSRDELDNMANGAAQQNISVGAVRGFHVPLVPDDILLDFRSAIRPIFEQIQNNSKEIQTLTTLRDTLLPRLISGKIKV